MTCAIAVAVIAVHAITASCHTLSVVGDAASVVNDTLSHHISRHAATVANDTAPVDRASSIPIAEYAISAILHCTRTHRNSKIIASATTAATTTSMTTAATFGPSMGIYSYTINTTIIMEQWVGCIRYSFARVCVERERRLTARRASTSHGITHYSQGLSADGIDDAMRSLPQMPPSVIFILPSAVRRVVVDLTAVGQSEGNLQVSRT